MTALTIHQDEPRHDLGRTMALLPSRAARWACLFILLTTLFAALSAVVPIPLTISADACQILLAADRLALGLGPTTIYPKVPEVDWAFINHWPVGYPLLLVAISGLLGLSTLVAAQVLNVGAFALSFIAWTAWFRRCLPDSPANRLLALSAGLLSLDSNYLWEPATDVILVALTPVMLLWTDRLTSRVRCESHAPYGWPSFLLHGAGVAALTWIRYSALYLTLGIGLFLVARQLICRDIRWRRIAAYGAGALTPLLLLAAVNSAFGSVIDEPPSAFGILFDWRWPVIWWNHFTALPFLRSWWRSPMIFAACIPLTAILIMLATPASRRTAGAYVRRPGVLLSISAVGGMFALLMLYRIFAHSFFVVEAEPRYLMCVRPFYLLLFAGPLLTLRWRALRRGVCLALLAAIYWLVQAEWVDATRLRADAAPPTTAYGRAARCFAAGPDELYRWLRQTSADDVIVFSNFFDEIALESHLPAQPLPGSAAALRDTVRRIAAARGCDSPRLLFVLEPDNQWRNYYLNAWDAIDLFGLTRIDVPSPVLRRYVYVPRRPESWIDDECH